MFETWTVYASYLGCSQGWTGRWQNGNLTTCFLLSDYSLIWIKAKYACQNQKAFLPVIEGEESWTFINYLAKQKYTRWQDYNKYEYWIGNGYGNICTLLKYLNGVKRKSDFSRYPYMCGSRFSIKYPFICEKKLVAGSGWCWTAI